MIKLHGTIRLDPAEQQIVADLRAHILSLEYWDGATGTRTGLATRRDALKVQIKEKLLIHCKNVCIYCCHYSPSNGTFVVEHFAPKSPTKYPEFTFCEENLLLSCWNCNNGFKANFDTVTRRNPIYRDCTFSMFHPIRDDFDTHFRIISHSTEGALFVPRSPEAKKYFEVFELERRFDEVFRNFSAIRDIHGIELLAEISNIYADRTRVRR